MNTDRLFKLGMVFSMLSLLSLASNAEQPRSMLDGNVEAAEASVVEIVTNSSGEVIQIRVEGCETCSSQSYLPSREIAVSVSGQSVSSGRLSGLSGQSGTLTLNADSGMVERVDFWSQRGGMRADQ